MSANNYYLGIIKAAVSMGFDFDLDDTILEVYEQAWNKLMKDKPYGYEFQHVEYKCHSRGVLYTFYDPDTDFIIEIDSSEIFDFEDHEECYFREEDGAFTPVSWYEIPDGDERRNYIFVFDYEVLSNGKIAYLYDYFE